MAQNIIEMVQNRLTECRWPNTRNPLEIVSGLLGENKSTVTAAVGSALPSILLGLMNKSAEPQGADSLFRTIQEGKHDGGILDNLEGLLGGGSTTTDFISGGTKLLGSLFGDKSEGVTDLVASKSGISNKSSSSLMGILAPVVMGLLGKVLKSQGNFNLAGLTDLLFGQKDYVKSLLPSGLTQLMGVTSLDNLGPPTVPTPQPAAPPPVKAWPWVLIILAALLALFAWRSCSKEEVVQKATETKKEVATVAKSTAEKATDTAKQAASAVQQSAEKAAQQARDAWAALGKFFSKKLPSGVELNIPELGVENKLIAFLDDALRPVDEKLWFSFDRLTFETGKATLKPESQEQLKNIAEILKAYPKVAIKIGGYTDNTGDPQANLSLSQQRADAVMAELVKMGVDASRMEAKGYGQEHPIADNATEEGRAKNRRIDLKVVSK